MIFTIFFFFASLVQLVERWFPKPDAVGSSPTGRVFDFYLLTYSSFSCIIFLEFTEIDKSTFNFIMPKKLVAVIKLALPAGKATPAPPVGPALGQHGLNIAAFCKDYNAQTGDKGDLIIPVEISAYEDRTYSFILKTPPASVLLAKAANVLKGSGEPNITKVGDVSRVQLEEIAKIKLPDLNTNSLLSAIKIVEGTARNMGLSVQE